MKQHYIAAVVFQLTTLPTHFAAYANSHDLHSRLCGSQVVLVTKATIILQSLGTQMLRLNI